MYNNLKQQIDEAIHANGMRQITGTVLNTVLNAIVDTMGAGLLFGGFVTPDSAEPADTEGKFYIAKGKGIFFGSISIYHDGVFIMRKHEDSWLLDTIYDGGIVFDISDGRQGLTDEEYSIVYNASTPDVRIIGVYGNQSVMFSKTEAYLTTDIQFSSNPVFSDNNSIIFYQGDLKARSTQGVHLFQITQHEIHLT